MNANHSRPGVTEEMRQEDLANLAHYDHEQIASHDMAKAALADTLPIRHMAGRPNRHTA
jgi:hypothetical protein